ncbi:MAG TPA: ABC transporter permease [Longimicrobiales bacterium]|nr:ABC transporter permease [Longimicrobiales bacterium]
MARKEWVQLRRDPRSMVLAFGMPLLMLLFFGYAISWDISDIRIAVIDQDRTASSRRLVEVFEASGYFSVVDHPETTARIDEDLLHGRVMGGLIIPPGFARDLAAGRPAPVQLLLDGSDANTATVALNYSSAIAAGFSRDVLLQGRRIEAPATAETRIWYNPTLESSNMIVPGLIAVIMSIIAAMLTALTIAREWERGTMEQLAATPVHRLEVVFGKLLPYLGIGLLDVATTVAAGVIIFDVPLRGSVLLLGTMTLLFLLGALGLGMFVSAVLKSQVLATQVAMVVTYLPALLLSGFLFDIASMPAALRAVSFIVPAKYYIAVTRGVFLKGVGPDVLWVQGVSMVIFAAIGIGLATAAFDKRIAA